MPVQQALINPSPKQEQAPTVFHAQEENIALQLVYQPQQEIVAGAISVFKGPLQQPPLEALMPTNVRSGTIVLQELLFKFHVIQDIIAEQQVLQLLQVPVLLDIIVVLKVHQQHLSSALQAITVFLVQVFLSLAREEHTHPLLEIQLLQIASTAHQEDTAKIPGLLLPLDLALLDITALDLILFKDLKLNFAKEVKDVLLKVPLLRIVLETIKIELIRECVLLAQQAITAQLTEEVNLMRRSDVTLPLLLAPLTPTTVLTT